MKYNPLLSVQSHYRNWIAEHYEKSAEGKELQKLKNIYCGQRCFIVANGPSLRAEDLDILQERHEITFGMNRIFKIFPETLWRPTYYICEDELIFKDCQKEIAAIPALEKFVPIEMKWFHDVEISDAKYFHINYDRNKDFEYSFSTDIPHQVDCRGTVTFTCMQFAVYMGFTEIYLLGVDHNYQRIIDIDGNVVEDLSAKDYFCDGYDSDIKDQVVHDMGNNTRAYLDAKKYCDESGRTTIFNTTRGGKLEVFERVDFDSLFH